METNQLLDRHIHVLSGGGGAVSLLAYIQFRGHHRPWLVEVTSLPAGSGLPKESLNRSLRTCGLILQGENALARC